MKYFYDDLNQNPVCVFSPVLDSIEFNGEKKFSEKEKRGVSLDIVNGDTKLCRSVRFIIPADEFVSAPTEVAESVASIFQGSDTSVIKLSTIKNMFIKPEEAVTISGGEDTVNSSDSTVSPTIQS